MFAKRRVAKLSVLAAISMLATGAFAGWFSSDDDSGSRRRRGRRGAPEDDTPPPTEDTVEYDPDY